MIKKLLYIGLINLCFFLQPINAQPICSVRTFNIRDGLAANIISGIAQTNDDIMWFATWNGLCCYDGYKFTTFRNISRQQEVLSTNRLLLIKPNHYGDIWCLTYDRQLSLFDTHSCRFIGRSNILKEKFNISKISTRNIYSLNNGFTWMVSDDGSGINFRFDDSKKDGSEGITPVYKRRIRKVMLDDNGGEWLFCKKGIERWNDHFYCPVNFEYMLPMGRKLVFASRKNNLGVFINGKMKEIKLPGKVTNIYCLDKFDNANILLGTSDGILMYNVNDNKFRHFSVVHPSQHGTEAKQIFVDKTKRIWTFSSGDGIIMINPKTDVTEWFNAKAETPDYLTTSKVPFIHQDEHGTIWTIPNNGSFSYFDEKQNHLTVYPLHSKGFGNICLPLISKYYIDSQNNLWFSGQHDLSIVNFKYRNITFKPLRHDQEVRGTYCDSKGRLWIGDDKGHLIIYTATGNLIGYLNKSGAIQKNETAFTNKVYGFFEDNRHRMWIATKGEGIYCLDNNSLVHYTHDDKNKWSLSHNDIYDIYQDRKGHILVASFEKGLNIIVENSKKGVIFINENNILTSYPRSCDKIRRITETKNGVILLSTSNGLVTFQNNFSNPSKIKFYHNNHVLNDTTSLLSSDVLQSYVTRNGDIYIATLGGGLQKMKSHNLLQNDIKYSIILPSAGIEGFYLSMIEDKQGKIWFVRESTLDVYDPKTGKTLNYDPYDIDEHTEFSEAKPAFNSNTGAVTVGMVGGFISFLPQKMRKSTYSPKIAFVKVQFQGESESQPILNTDELDVPSDKRNLTITFSALDYNNNDLIQYAYMLEGVDRKWNFVGSAHSASFNNLPPGHHRLLVRSTNSDGIWMQNQKVLKIYSHPSFWESGWAWPVYIILLAGIIFIASYIYMLKERNKLSKEMNEMKTNFFNNIGHKLRTPLTLIGGPVTEILKHNDLKEEYRKALEMVQRNSRSMLELVNNMLNYNSSDNYFVDDINAPVFAGQAENTESTGNSNNDKSTTLLIVEDNNDLRSFLVSILSQDYNVISAENGKVGLDKADKEMPDFIITDVMMPEMDGLTMVRNIKRNRNISHIPIIVLSAKASMEDRIKGLKEGIDDYITKPFSATYLKQRVENIIGQRHILQQTYLEQMKDVGSNDAGKKEFNLDAPEIIDNDKLMIDKLMNYIEEHIGDSDLKIEDLATAVNMGRTVFYGKIKSIIGMTPIDFVRHIRIQRAEELVAHSKQTFSQIAYSLGFSDPKYFTKCFKKDTGMTPSEYRAKVNS